MSQHNFDITKDVANTGAAMRAAINAALQALASASSGATEPGTKYPYQFWADTTSGYMKQRNAGNTAWINLFKLDGSAGGLFSPFAGPGLTQEFSAKSLALANIRDNTPNVLDCVEKGGTFTPALRFGGNNVGIAYSQQKGSYTRIGDVFVALVNITLTSKGSSTGTVTITGMPMAAASSGMSGAVIGATGMVSQAAYVYAGISGATLYLRKQSSTGYIDLSDADFSNTSQINITIIYLV